MGKSARVLGWELGKTAQEMNALLKEHGYLYGEPGAYGLTEKGKDFGQEEDHHRGTGGYAHYNRNWTTRTWDESILDALSLDMLAADKVVEVNVETVVVDTIDAVSRGTDQSLAPIAPPGGHRVVKDDAGHNDTPKWLAIGLVVILALVFIAPPARRWWRKVAAPAVRRTCQRLTRSNQDGALTEGSAVRSAGGTSDRALDAPRDGSETE